METKLIAAEIATAAGVTTVITSSKNPEDIVRIIEYHSAHTPSGDTSSPPPAPPQDSTPSPPVSPPSLPRPRHTVFTPSPIPLRDLKAWTSHTLYPAGSIVIDTGAHHVLSRRESGGRLLPVGVLGVQGAFASGQAVRIVVLRKGTGEGQHEDADGEAVRAKYARGLSQSQPGTPPVLAGPVSAPDPLFERHFPPANPPGDSEESVRAESESGFVEVGRGLANYNSEQIAKVKGLNR
jgi:glutamate 5-kinase